MADEKQKTIQEEAGLPENWQPVDVPTITPGLINGVPTPSGGNPYLIGSIPSFMSHDSDFVKSGYRTPSVPVFPLMPPAPSAQPQINAAIKSATTPATPAVASFGMIFRGLWASHTTYNKNDVVLFNTAAYVAIQTSAGISPETSTVSWTLLSENLVFNPSITTVGTIGFGIFDKASAAFSTGTAVLVGPVTPAVSNEVALFFVNEGSGTIPTMPAGWSTFDSPGSGGIANTYAYLQAFSSVAPITATATISSTPWAAGVLLFPYGTSSANSFVANVGTITRVGSLVTVTASNSFLVGGQVTFSGLTSAAGLLTGAYNIVGVSSTQFTFNTGGSGAYGPTADTGTAIFTPMVQDQNVSGAWTSHTFSPFVSNTVKGRTIVVVASGDGSVDGSPTMAATDTQGNVYQNNVIHVGGTTYLCVSYAQNIAGGPCTVSIVMNTLVSSSQAKCYEVLSAVIKGYVPYDVVEFKGSFYVCLADTTADPAGSPTSWGQLSQGTGGVDALTSVNNTASAADYGRIKANSTTSNCTVNLPNPPITGGPELDATWWIGFQNVSTGSIIVSPNGLLLDGSASNLTLGVNQGVLVFTDGVNYFTERGMGTGSVTSVGLTVPSWLTVAGSPIVGAGTLAVTATVENANTILAGPVSGAAAAPTFRLLVPADLSVQAPIVNVTPVTVSANVSTDQNLMAGTINANVLNSVGRTLKLWGAGLFTTPALSVATITVKVKLGAVTLATFTSSANPGTVTNNSFNFELKITTQTAGASAVFEVHGNMTIDLGASPGLADSVFSDINTAVSSAVNSTISNALQITIAFSSASASNSATQRQMIGEFVN
jgi:hypothetical protein